jgi:stress-induced morphogen
MGIRLIRGDTDQIIERITQAFETYLKDHPGADIALYRQNSVSVRVRIVDAVFGGKSRPERSDMVWKYLEGLCEDDQSEISSLILLAPDETEKSFANFEFENPIPSGL